MLRTSLLPLRVRQATHLIARSVASTRCFSILSSRSPATLNKHREMLAKIANYQESSAKATDKKGEAVTAKVDGEGSAGKDIVEVEEGQQNTDLTASGTVDKRHIMSRVLQDLGALGDLHDSTMKVIENSEEWKDYDAHVSFELLMLKHRYQNSDMSMTTSRRTQMQAHLRQKQLQIMEQHAEASAEEYLESLTPEQITSLREKLLSIDVAPPAGHASALQSSAPTVSDEELSAALKQLSTEVASIAHQSKLAGKQPSDAKARPQMPDNFEGKTLDEIRDLFDQREEEFENIPFTSPHTSNRR